MFVYLFTQLLQDRMLLMMKIAHNKEKIELNKSSTISNEIIIHIKNCIIGSNDNGSSNYNDTISVPHSNNGSQKNINRRKSTIFRSEERRVGKECSS